MSLARDEVALLIPHSGAMVLLDEVVHWNEAGLRARTRSHLNADNPLRDACGLHIVCGIEYAAQAMALHGALCSTRSPENGPGRARVGLLANVRDVRFLARRLDEDATDLIVDVRPIASSLQAAIYEFAASSLRRELLAGRATVVFDAIIPPDRQNAGPGAGTAGGK